MPRMCDQNSAVQSSKEWEAKESTATSVSAASSEKNMRESVACISPLTGKFHFGREVDREREGMLFGEC